MSQYWFPYGFLLTLPLEIWLSLFAPTLASVRCAAWVANILGLIVIYAALIKFVRSDALRVVGACFLWMIPLAAFSLTIPMAARYGVGFLPLLFWPRKPIAAGAMTVIALCTSQEIGAAGLARPEKKRKKTNPITGGHGDRQRKSGQGDHPQKAGAHHAQRIRAHKLDQRRVDHDESQNIGDPGGASNGRQRGREQRKPNFQGQR
jgi:hypothetical protein